MQPLRDAWCTDVDLMEAASQEPFHRACLLGDAAAVAAAIAAVCRGADEAAAVRRLVERRMSLLRLSAIANVVYGVRLEVVPGFRRPPGRYAETLQLLLAASASPNARDNAGYNAIAGATGVGACAATLTMVSSLVAAGGDPNAVTCFGEPIIVVTIMTGNAEALKALLDAGAVPSLDVPFSSGPSITPAQMVHKSPVLMRALGEWRRGAEKGARFGAAGGDPARQQYKQCLTVYYCGRPSRWPTGSVSAPTRTSAPASRRRGRWISTCRPRPPRRCLCRWRPGRWSP